MDTQHDVIIVGGGMAGLSAAALLARGGAKVLLFERSDKAGGRAATENHAGYLMNRGAHAIYRGGAASKVMAELGVEIRGAVPTGTYALMNGKVYPLPATASGLLRTNLFDAGDKWEFMKLFAGLALLKPQAHANTSAQDWINAHAKRPTTRRTLAALARTATYTAALDRVSAEVMITQLQLATKVLYVHGGWQSMADGLRAKATELGARIESGTRVESVEYSDGRVTGVRLADGRLLVTPAVIVATEPQDAARLLDAGAYAPLRRIIDGLTPVQIACLDVALNVPPGKYPVVFSTDAPLFHTAQSVYANVAPAGGSVIHTVKYLDPARPDDPRADARDLEGYLDKLQPGWRERLVQRNFLPHITVTGALPTAAGGGLAGRPGPHVPGIAGLLLAGDWVGPEGYLVDASVASAREAAKLLLGGELAAAKAAERRTLVATR